MTVRLGIIGFGSMGRWMAEALALAPGLRLVGVAEPAPGQARAARDSGLPVFDDHRRLLEQPAEPAQPETDQEAVSAADEYGYRYEAARHFADVARGEATPRATLEDGRAALRLELALLESARQDEMVYL
jgi:predicted dehydrogenase